MELKEKIENIMAIGFWAFDGLPKQVQVKLDGLTIDHKYTEILSTMESLVSKFEIDEKQSSKDKGNSGISGEMHMASAMRLKYLNQSIAYIESKMS